MKRFELLLLISMLVHFAGNAQYENWQFSNSITIDNSQNPNTLNDYSVLVKVDTKYLIDAGLMNADGSDIRFTSDMSNSMSYWIEPGIQNERGIYNQETHIWVKVPLIPGSSTSTIYMLYGNTSATAVSDISSTFLFGDDFDDNTFDTSKWEAILVNSGQIIEQNQRLEHHSPATDPESISTIQSYQQFTEPVVLEFQFKKGGYVYRNAAFTDNYSTMNNVAGYGWQDWGQLNVTTTINGTSYGESYPDQYWSTNNGNPEYYFKIIRKPDGNFSYRMDVPSIEPSGPVNWNVDVEASMPLSTPLKVFAREHMWKNAGAQNDRYEDNIRVRKYSSPEPTTIYNADSDPIAYYPLNGNGNDASGNGNHGTTHGTLFTTDRFGNSNGALSFDGSSYILGSSTNFPTGERTVSLWFKANTFSNFPVLFGYGGYDCGQSWFHALNHGGNVSYTITSHCGANTLNYNYPLEPINYWHHWVVTTSILGTKMYVNGFLVAENSNNITTTNVVDKDFTIGVGVSPTGYGPYTDENMGYFIGALDDIKIYNRALNHSEINELFHEDGWGSVTDIDGNNYSTVVIGEQEWMAENLKTTRYSNGGNISNVADNTAWTGLSTGGYCWYNNDQATYGDIYGALYNWYAVNDSRNICPIGWHVPSDEDWYVMESLIDPTITDPNAEGPRGINAGIKLKATTGWEGSGNGMDVFGFSALPGGNRTNDTGNFGEIGTRGWWWNSTEGNENYAWHRRLDYDKPNIIRYLGPKNYGYSVRCIKNEGIQPDEFAGGTGTEEDPYLIETAQHLYNIRNYLGSEHSNKFFKQIADIDLGVSPWNDGEGWEPIGSLNPNNWDDPSFLTFNGSFKGEGYSISNLTINQPSKNGVGLFGHVHGGASLSNIILINVNINGYAFAGSLVGLIKNISSVYNCYSSGAVEANNEAGGIAGRISGQSEIISCSSSCIVAADNYAGGIVGINGNLVKRCRSYSNVDTRGTGAYFGGIAGKNEGTIEESLAGSSVYGYDNTGGITGYNTGSVLNCFSIGSVQGNQHVGGLIGRIESGSITNCYSIGSVTGVTNYGGFIGSFNSGSITSSYWNTQTSGQSTSAGGEGRTTDQMTSSYDESTFVDWDFNLIWGEDFDYTINNGYPYLRMQDYDPPSVETYNVSYVTSHTAMAGGNVTIDNGIAVTDRGIIWDLDEGLELEWENYSGLVYCGEGLGEFTGILQPLAPGTTYYYRAFAVSAAGYAYGNTYSFVTPQAMDICIAVDNCQVNFLTGGDSDWFGQNVTTHDGVDATQSGYLGDNSNSNFYTTIAGPGLLSFYWKASSEQDYDMLQFFINNELMDGISGETGWEYMEYSITEGSLTLKWQFSKDDSGSEGQDCGWVDQIVYQQTGIPEVISCGESSVTATTAILCGEVTHEGNTSVTDRGAVWGSTPEISINNYLGIKYEGGTGTGTFEVQATELTPSTTYYYKTFAINSIGVGYSNAESFTTETVANQYFVNQASGNDANDGKSWANAFATLQMALDAAIPQESQEIEIWVAAGTYTPTSTYGLGSEQELRHFQLKNYVALYGGFVGTETSIDERDWESNQTILTGDLNGDDYWNGEEWQNIGDNCYHVFYHNDLWLNNSAILDGFTVQNGMARPSGLNHAGGGMMNGNSSPTVRNVTFKHNGSFNVYGGGGVHNSSSEALFVNCYFISNYTDGYGGSGGGGMFNGSSSTTIINSIFIGNYSESVGGAAWETAGSTSSYINCLFVNNTSSSQGGAITCNESSPTIVNSTFTGSSPYAFLSGTSSYPNIVNSVFWNNSSGQIYDFGDSQTSVSYTNVQGGWEGEGNINVDPQFVDPSNGNYSLTGSSLCINAGTNWPFEEGQVADGITIDLAGNQRIFNYYVDMGAYEYQDLPSNLPVVTTKPVTSITSNSAICGGNVLYDNGFAVTQRGVILSTQPNTTFDTPNYISTDNGSGTGEFTSDVSGLNIATTYYIRAYANNQIGTGYGEEIEFRTHFATISNINVDPDLNSAYISLHIQSNVLSATYWITYSNDPELTNAINTTEYTIFTTETIQATFNLTDLDENTNYYYQIVVEYNDETNYTDTYHFRTLCSYTIYTTVPNGPNSVCAGDVSHYSTYSENAEEYTWQISPSDAGTIEPGGNTATVQWSETFSGTATLKVNGISGSCQSQESTLEVEVILNISDIVISGESQVCNQSRVIYTLSRNAVDFTWQVDGTSTIVESDSHHAVVVWSGAGSNSVRVVEQASSGCPSQSVLSVSISSSGSAPAIPVIHRKGNINILICTTPNMSYKWFYQNQILGTETKQYYIARNNLGDYNVQVKNSSQCPNTSDAYSLNTYVNAESLLTVFPNPTTGAFYIEAESETIGKATLIISDTFGKIVHKENLVKTEYILTKQINNLNLPKGLYIVKLVIGNDIPLNSKLTIY